jgi:hypothetical protein
MGRQKEIDMVFVENILLMIGRTKLHCIIFFPMNFFHHSNFLIFRFSIIYFVTLSIICPIMAGKLERPTNTNSPSRE